MNTGCQKIPTFLVRDEGGKKDLCLEIPNQEVRTENHTVTLSVSNFLGKESFSELKVLRTKRRFFRTKRIVFNFYLKRKRDVRKTL